MTHGSSACAPRSRVRLVMIDDQTSVREMLAWVLHQDPRFEVVGEACTGWEALKVCRESRPDMAILDLALPELNGVEVLRRLKEHQQKIRFLVYSGVSHSGLATDALRLKPNGYVHKRDPFEILREGIRAVADGRSYYSVFAAELLQAGATVPGEPPLPLGAREREVLQLIAEGWRTKEIASRLGISVKTTENHRARLMLKLGRNGVAALTRYAVQMGMVQLH